MRECARAYVLVVMYDELLVRAFAAENRCFIKHRVSASKIIISLLMPLYIKAGRYLGDGFVFRFCCTPPYLDNRHIHLGVVARLRVLAEAGTSRVPRNARARGDERDVRQSFPN